MNYQGGGIENKTRDYSVRRSNCVCSQLCGKTETLDLCRNTFTILLQCLEVIFVIFWILNCNCSVEMFL